MPLAHLVLGNINVDITLYVKRLPELGSTLVASEALIAPGGAAVNYAIASARAGHKPILIAHTTRIIGSKLILNLLSREGVDISRVVVHDEGWPGIVVVMVDSKGNRTMVKHPGVNTLLRGDEVRGLRSCPQVVHGASVAPVVLKRCLSVLELEGCKPRLVSYDPGGSIAREYGGSIIRELEGTRISLYVNEDEARSILGSMSKEKLLETVDRLSEALILVKRGEKGALLVMKNLTYCVDAYKEAGTVDTTGAGDVFNAYLNTLLVEGASIETALVYASIAAGIKVSRKGAGVASPYRREVERVIKLGRYPKAKMCDS
ncbi:MAG: PfkB family carbohydrate kinase [Pyrodictiaceae archaeon]